MTRSSEHRPPLIIVGGSTRAAAYSAVRAGFQPICFDLFADLDTQQVGPTERVDPYPQGLTKALANLPECPVMFVGALENHPELIDEIATQRPVWGVTGESLRTCRTAAQLREVLRISRAPMLEWRDAGDAPTADGSWMLRPLAGSGGQGILPWDAEVETAVAENGGIGVAHGYQQRVHGEAYSALFLAASEVGDVQFVGVTRQLTGVRELGAGPNIWCGNIGPATLPVHVEHLVRRVGNVLKWKCKLQGIFGVDFILDDQQQPWVTEVNPRYPASTELLEWAAQSSLLWNHAHCFGFDEFPHPSWQAGATKSYLGKAIVYATVETCVSSAVDRLLGSGDAWDFPTVADLPARGTRLAAGEPLCTVFAAATSSSECEQQLLVNAAEVRAALTAN